MNFPQVFLSADFYFGRKFKKFSDKPEKCPFFAMRKVEGYTTFKEGKTDALSNTEFSSLYKFQKRKEVANEI